jgi:FMN-dependent NADH-azoreductase
VNLLHVDASPTADGLTRQMGARFVAHLRESDPALAVTHLDLAAEPPPHVNAGWVAADTTAPDARDDAMRATLAPSERYIAQLFTADALVLGVPMHNFTVPATFKAWIDQVARHGETFRFVPDGVEGFLSGRPALVLTARGAYYAEADPASDFQEPYLRKLLGFLGIDEVRFVHVEGVALSGETPEALLTAVDSELSAAAEAWGAHRARRTA